MKRSKRSLAATKANVTRRARKLFRDAYPHTAGIAEDILCGYDSADIADAFDVTVGTVAAVKANLCRDNRFAYMAYDCNFK